MPQSFQITDPPQAAVVEPVNQAPVVQPVQQQPVQQQPVQQQIADTLATSRDAQLSAVISYMRGQGVPDDAIAKELGITFPSQKPQQNGNPFVQQQQPVVQQQPTPQVDANGNPVVQPVQQQPTPQVDANGNPVVQPETGLQSAFLRGNSNNLPQVTPEALPELLTKELNINPSTPEGAGQLVNSIRKWRGDSQKFADVNKKFKELDGFLEALPEDIKGALSLHAEGKPYKGLFTGDNSFVADYNKDFSTLTPEEVISFAKSLDTTFNLTKEDINKPENGIVKISLSKAWDGAKTSFESQKQLAIQQTTQKQQGYKSSVDASMIALEDKYKGMFNEAEKKDISSLLKPQALLAALYDKNGYPKVDAAEKISYLLYGSQLLNDVKLLSTNNGRNEGIIEALNTNGNQQVRQRPTTDSPQELAEQQLSSLKSYIGKKTY